MNAERKVTALKVQKRNPNRVNVYLDGEYAFGLSRIVAAWLQVGQVLSEEKIRSLQQEETREAAYQRALHYLSFRPRSEAEVRRKLLEKGFDQLLVEEIIERLRAERWLGDSEFARLWTENRTTFRPRSRRLLRFELRQKGVSEDHIEEALHPLAEESELAYEAGIRYARRLTSLQPDVFRKRLTAFLARRGFSYGTIAPVVRRICSEQEMEQPKT
ncbi:MAG: regulatory protein RecX [Bellilinea sp.]|nr:MAG: regulatory protein RecX [Bellilinea sp.]